MPRQSTPRDKVLGQLVERQISWSHLQQRIRTLSERSARHERIELGPFLTISRTFGAGAGELARRIGDELGWAVIDQEIVEHLADHLEIDQNVVQQLDETGANWVRDLIGDLSLAPTEVLTHDGYVTSLRKVVTMTALHGKVIFVGRGAQFFLPRTQGLRVRLVATEEDCLARIQERLELDAQAARKLYRSRCEASAKLVHRYFGLDIADPRHYDLVVSTRLLSLAQVAELVVTACRQRGLTG